MKHMLRQVFHSGKFVTGFVIFTAILLTVFLYPLIITDSPLAIIGQGTFFPPGIYVNVFDSINSPAYTIMLDDAAAKRIASRLNDEDRAAIREWLVGAGIPEGEIDIANTEALLGLWVNNYDSSVRIAGQTNADRNYYIRLNKSLQVLLATEGVTIAAANPDTGALAAAGSSRC